jgi:hypothetical protein
MSIKNGNNQESLFRTMKYRNFTHEEIAMIQERFLIDGAQSLAIELHREVDSIHRKAWQLGIRSFKKSTNPRTKNWTAAEDEIIRNEWPAISSRRRGNNAETLAKKLGVSAAHLRTRVIGLGLRRARIKDSLWTEEEIEKLHEFSHLSVRTIYRRFKRLGFNRTENAITVARNRYGALVTKSDGAYTAQSLSKLMGVTAQCVGGCIKRGWIKATPRSDARTECGGVGDRWLIYPKDVREFIREYRGSIHIAKCDQHWLLDLIFGNEGGPVKIQHSSGSRAESGLSEHGAAA